MTRRLGAGPAGGSSETTVSIVMDGKKILAALLLVGGIAALIYGNFGYPRQTPASQSGNLEVTLLAR